MSATKQTARFAGFLYLLLSITGVLSVMVIAPRFVVSGDATATAAAISGGDLLYRAGILISLTANVLFVFLVLTLYRLFENVDRRFARLMVALVLVSTALSCAVLLLQFVPLVLLSGAEYLNAFTKPQLDALSLGALRLHSNGMTIASAFWGLWLYPFAFLVLKSGFIPRIFGILLLLAGSAYVIGCAIGILVPAHRGIVSRVLLPLQMGEAAIIFWLLIKGVRESRLESRPPLPAH